MIENIRDIYETDRSLSGYETVSQYDLVPTSPTNQELGSHFVQVNEMTPNSENEENVTGIKNRLYQWRFLEFLGSLIGFAISAAIYSAHVHERPIPVISVRVNIMQTVYARDPSIDQQKLKEHFPMSSLLAIGIIIPTVVHLTIAYIVPVCTRVDYHIRHDTRDFLLSLVQSMSMSVLFTQYLKSVTGRFRPCFYHMCQWDYNSIWDGTSDLCTAPEWDKEGRKSFPSGHSSFAWSTLFLLTLYLLGRSQLVVEDRHIGVYRGVSKLLKLSLCFLPTFLAAWIALTRTLDNWHHYSDIIVGSLIGAGSAALSYAYNYGSIFHYRSAGLPLQEYYRIREVRKEDSACKLKEDIWRYLLERNGDVEQGIRIYN